MLRRDLLRVLSATAVAPALPPELSLLLRQAQAPAEYALRTLTPHQSATIVAMIGLIIPVTDTRGAKAARVNEFMDVILTDWATDAERARFLKGLDDVDTQCNALFGKNFVDGSTPQQTAILQALDDSVDWPQGPPADHESGPRHPRNGHREDGAGSEGFCAERVQPGARREESLRQRWLLHDFFLVRGQNSRSPGPINNRFWRRWACRCPRPRRQALSPRGVATKAATSKSYRENRD